MRLNFKHRIKVYEEGYIRDPLGQQIPQKKYKGDYWADIKTMQGREVHTAAVHNVLKTTLRFIVRYQADFHSRMRFEYQGTEYSVIEIINDNMANKTLTIVAESE